jgi:hypothetical protein
MATEKIVNYTEAQTKEIVDTYVNAPVKATVEALAVKFGKSTKSIVAKLAREKVYQTEAKASGSKSVTKAELVADIAKLAGNSPEVLESLEKATAPALRAVLYAMVDMFNQVVQARADKLKAE